jgi:pyrroloquinoline quinone biosynthesis protein B
MQVRVLGAAAGGAFPQWNCSCSNCSRQRQGHFTGSPRSQNQLAISVDGVSWILLNASPDLRYQIESFPPLHPHSSPVRHSPIAAIILPSAEVDATLGLLLLREFQPLTVYATSSVRQILTEDNSMFGVLRRIPNQVTWIDIVPGEAFFIGNTGIRCNAVTTESNYPGFVSAERAAEFSPEEAVIGLYLEHAGHRVAFFPGARAVMPEWTEEFNRCDAVLFDGTFWSQDELILVHGSGKQARDMGHQPVSETLRAFQGLNARKIFIHINNTNPILDDASPEQKAVREAGWDIAYDGMDLRT